MTRGLYRKHRFFIVELAMFASLWMEKHRAMVRMGGKVLFLHTKGNFEIETIAHQQTSNHVSNMSSKELGEEGGPK